MCRIIPILLLFHLPALLQGQVIRGVVYGRVSGEAVGLADIYFDGTTVGTSSDQSGHFSLDISRFPDRPLSVSAIGYYSRTITDLDPNSTYVIFLEPRMYEIEELTVGVRSLLRERRKNLKRFRLEFLGTSHNARSCQIMNEEVITFNYGSDQDTLYAYARAPLHIINRALGYDIVYYLDKFFYARNQKTISFVGTIIYKEDPATGFDTYQIERRRRIAYSGSCMHFFRVLWRDELDETPFKVQNEKGEELNCSQIVLMDENGSKYLRYEGPLEVIYYTNWSQIDFKQDKVSFEESGFYDPNGLSWRGKMSKNRVGDWLPHDYISE